MASGRINGSVTANSNKFTFYLNWSSVISIEGNYSDVTVTSYFAPKDGWEYWDFDTTGTRPVSITINGSTSSTDKVISTGDNWSNGNPLWVYSYTKRVYHDTDGSKSITVSARANGRASDGSTNYGPSASVNSSDDCVASGTVKLDTIPRKSSVAVSTVNIGSAPTFTITRASDSFTHTLRYSFHGLSGTIVEKTTSVSYKSFSWPTTFYAKIPDSKSGIGIVYCDTYNGNTLIGTSEAAFIATVSESASNPTLSPTVVDTNATTIALTGDANKLIRYYSNAKATSNAAARNSATLESQKIVNGSSTIPNASGTFYKVSSGKFVFTVTDSREYSVTKTVDKTIVNYIYLTCNLTAENPDPSGNMTFTINGNCFNGSFGAVSNTLTLQYQYKEETGEYGDWITVTATRSGNTYSYTGSLTGLDYRKAYRIVARATDKLDSVESGAIPFKTIPVFDWGENDFNFNVPVTLTDGYVVYPLLGLCKAMTSVHNCSVSVTPGENYDSASGSATICGNTLRCNLTATRSSAYTGNAANEVVATFSIAHGGRISGMLNVSLSNGSAGAVASLYTSNVSQTEETLDFTVYLAAAAGSTTEINSFFQVPVTINLQAYV